MESWTKCRKQWFSDVALLWSLETLPADEGSPGVARIVFLEAVSRWWFREAELTQDREDKPVVSEGTSQHSWKMRPLEFSGQSPWEEEATERVQTFPWVFF